MKNFRGTRLKMFIGCLSLFFMVALSAFKSDSGVIKGKLEGAEGTLIKLTYRHNGKDIVDSAILRANNFSLNIAFPETVICTLSNSTNQQIKIFIAENKAIDISGSVAQFHALKIVGGSENSLFESFKAKSYQLSGDYRKDLATSGADRKDRKSPPYLKYQARIDSLTLDFVKKNNESTAAALAMIDSYLNDGERKRAANAYSFLSQGAKKGAYAKRIKQFIDTEVLIQKGNLAPLFTLNDLDGKSVKLADYKGRYVLLDFWASWCPPCRAEHPLLIELQSKYGNKIEFVSVSMDASSMAWKQAVKADQLTWTQLNDPRTTNGEVADSYGFKALPFNCIVDPEGKIVATKLRGHDLERFLSELFNKPKGK